ncbi:MAG: hypothetical protein Q9167_003202, partial [Letrouitia subvulpina]
MGGRRSGTRTAISREPQSASRSRSEKGQDGLRYREPNTASINGLKSKIRDLTRMLNHAQNLPAGVRIEKERALAGYQQDLERTKAEQHRQHTIKKYHMVRFFERQKASRNLKRCQNRLASATLGDPNIQDLREDVHAATVDLNYTLFYPLIEKYVSLFPRNESNGKVSGNSGNTLQHAKPAMWKIVENCMLNGQLEALREGPMSKVIVNASNLQQCDRADKTRIETPKDKHTNNNAARKSLQPQENNAESEQDFFE